MARVTRFVTRFAAGDRVRVRALGKAGHVRIPHYIRGHVGEVVQYCGRYLNPEDLSLGKTNGQAIDLYRVSFPQSQLWSNEAHPPQDRLVLEVYDHWLDAERDQDAP